MASGTLSKRWPATTAIRSTREAIVFVRGAKVAEQRGLSARNEIRVVREVLKPYQGQSYGD
ncbi:hypothetical protein QQP08_015427 [Theobroma cacao]|nr:hypothetical protein QQP08_015427 [Theobroma cacao]